MRISRDLRDVFHTPAGIAAFLVTCLLLLASLYPLIIMVRTAFMSVGDPIQGSPAEIVLARGDMTAA
jgi:hypothetical protein